MASKPPGMLVHFMPTLSRVAISSILCMSLGAQTFDLDKSSPATLGNAMQLSVRNAPASALMLWMPSFSAGPTPIALLDPTDPRELNIGLDLSGVWSSTITSPAGTAATSLALPLDPSYSGLLLHWQCMTIPGATAFVGAISNDVLTITGMPTTSQLLPASLAEARGMPALAAMPQTDFNSVLVTGGGGGSLTGSAGLATTEVYDTLRLAVRPGPNMTTGRVLHLAVLLNDGRTLLIGGADALGAVTASCEIYNPSTNTFTATGNLLTGRVLHAAARLPDGRVMTAGGTSTVADTTTAISNTLNSVEIYNPATGTWSSGPAIGGRRLAPALTLLSTGRVMVSGGIDVGLFFGIPISAVSTSAVQLYNPATNTWSAGAAMPGGRAGHQYNQVTLADNRVLMTGGINLTSLLNAATAGATNSASIYNPSTNTWLATTMAQPRFVHTATRLSNGSIAVCGGSQGTLTTPTAIADAELFNPVTNTWSSLPPLQSARTSHVAKLQPDGLLVLIGGTDGIVTLTNTASLHF